jgi:hypothetical protein
MGRYASQTTVRVSKSQNEIEDTLRRYGATGFASGWSEKSAMIAFQMDGRQVKFFLLLPNPSDDEFTKTPARGSRRDPQDAHRVWEQACRQRWRALALVIKAKLEAVAAGITVFEDEFMSHIVLPDGKTVGQHVRPMIDTAYATGKVQPLLPHYT